MHAALVRPNEHATLTHVAQVAPRRRLGFVGQAQEALCVVAQDVAGIGEGAVPRRAVDEPLAKGLFEPPNRLARRRLRPPELPGRARKAAFGGDGDETRRSSRVKTCEEGDISGSGTRRRLATWRAVSRAIVRDRGASRQ